MRWSRQHPLSSRFRFERRWFRLEIESSADVLVSTSSRKPFLPTRSRAESSRSQLELEFDSDCSQLALESRTLAFKTTSSREHLATTRKRVQGRSSQFDFELRADAFNSIPHRTHAHSFCRCEFVSGAHAGKLSMASQTAPPTSATALHIYSQLGAWISIPHEFAQRRRTQYCDNPSTATYGALF